MSDYKTIHPNLTRDLAAVCQLTATAWVNDFVNADEEAGLLAVDLVDRGLARLEMTTSFEPGRAPAHRLLLLPVDGDGAAVEIAALGCQPIEPTAEGVAARIWFFGRLSHWQPKH